MKSKERTQTQTKCRSWTRLGVLAAVALATTANFATAETGTWNGGNGGTWDVTDNNWIGLTPGTPWDNSAGPGNTAVFGTVGDAAVISGVVFPGAIQFNESASVSGVFIGFANNTSTISLDAAATKTGTISNSFLLAGAPVAGDGNRIFKTGAGTVTLTGDVQLVGDVEANLNAGFTVEGGGELQISNTLKAASMTQSANRGNFLNRVGDTTSNNTLRVDGTMFTTVFTGGLVVGNTGANNSVYISRPGDVGTDSYRMRGNGQQLVVGNDSDDNYFEVSNGAYFQHEGGNGTTGVRIGYLAGADNNQIVVTGSNVLTGASTMHLSSGSIIVGTGGSNNNFTVSAGGRVITPRWTVGVNSDFGQVTGGAQAGAGDNNSVLLTGVGTTSESNAGNNTLFEIGAQIGGDGNHFDVEDGATFTMIEGGTNRYFAVGRGGDNNYLRITGAGSTVTVTNTNKFPIGIGGTANNSPAGQNVDGGTGNHIDVFDGGVLTTNASVVAMGTNSALNIGDANAVATVTVGSTTNFATGVFLKNASGRLNFDNGRLIGTVAGDLVSGLGEVVLNGAAYIQTGVSNNVTTAISGVGDLHKEGLGTLSLTSLSNSYTGDTYVDMGILSLTDDYLADAADVIIATGAMMDLLSGATDTIGGLSYGAFVGTPGLTYGSTSSGANVQNDTFFSGTGRLLVTALFEGGGGGPGEIPAPAALPAGLALMGLAAMRRRRK